MRPRKGNFPGFPEGPSAQSLGVGICSTLLYEAWHYKEPGITRSLALQGGWHYKEAGITAAHPGEKIKAFAPLKGATTALAAAECKTRSGRTDGNAGGVARGHPEPQSTALPASSSCPARQDTACLASGERERGWFPPGTCPVGAEPPGERDKLTVVQRFLRLGQDCALLGRFRLISLPFDVAVLGPCRLLTSNCKKKNFF